MVSHFLNDLPESVQEIADVIGRDGALRLVCQMPVSYRAQNKRSPKVILYVPKRLKPGHRLVAILGTLKAQKLIEAFGGETLYPANCRFVFDRYRDDAVRQMVEEGERLPVVACMFDITERHVRNLCRKK